MAYSSIQYIGDGESKRFTVPFSSLQDEDLKVTVEGQAVAFDLLAGNVLSFRKTPPGGSVIEIKRQTPIYKKAVHFSLGSSLSSALLNKNADQVLMTLQEHADLLEHCFKKNTKNVCNLKNARLTGLKDPKDPKDATSKGWVESLFAGMQIKFSESLEEQKALSKELQEHAKKAENLNLQTMDHVGLHIKEIYGVKSMILEEGFKILGEMKEYLCEIKSLLKDAHEMREMWKAFEGGVFVGKGAELYSDKKSFMIRRATAPLFKEGSSITVIGKDISVTDKVYAKPKGNVKLKSGLHKTKKKG